MLEWDSPSSGLSNCIHVYTYTRINVFTSTWTRWYIKKGQNDNKREKLYNYNNVWTGMEIKDVAVSQCAFPTNGHAVASNWLSGKRLRPTYSIWKMLNAVSWRTFQLNDFALTSCYADIKERSFIQNSNGTLYGIIKTSILTQELYLLANNTNA